MKMQPRGFVITLIVGIWTLAGINAEGKEEAMAVFLMSDKGETSISLQAGQCFSLKFVTSPGTGYSWMLAAPLDEKMLIVKEMRSEAPENGLLGASEYEIWLCQALRAGKSEIALKYVRPWEKDLDPLRTHVFKVLIR